MNDTRETENEPCLIRRLSPSLLELPASYLPALYVAAAATLANTKATASADRKILRMSHLLAAHPKPPAARPQWVPSRVYASAGSSLSVYGRLTPRCAQRPRRRP